MLHATGYPTLVIAKDVSYAGCVRGMKYTGIAFQ